MPLLLLDSETVSTSSELVLSTAAIGLVIAAFKLLYRSLNEERERTVQLGLSYQLKLKEKNAEFQLEKEAWVKERNYLKQDIEALRAQVADLYNKLYSIYPEEG